MQHLTFFGFLWGTYVVDKTPVDFGEAWPRQECKLSSGGRVDHYHSTRRANTLRTNFNRVSETIQLWPSPSLLIPKLVTETTDACGVSPTIAHFRWTATIKNISNLFRRILCCKSTDASKNNCNRQIKSANQIVIHPTISRIMGYAHHTKSEPPANRKKTAHMITPSNL